jgi:hypothetical protein
MMTSVGDWLDQMTWNLNRLETAVGLVILALMALLGIAYGVAVLWERWKGKTTR